MLARVLRAWQQAAKMGLPRAGLALVMPSPGCVAGLPHACAILQVRVYCLDVCYIATVEVAR